MFFKPLVAVICFFSPLCLAGLVDWSQYPPVVPWGPNSPLHHPNHSNLPPETILSYLGDAPSHCLSAAWLRIAQAVQRVPDLTPEQRSVLLRDCLDRFEQNHSLACSSDIFLDPDTIVFYETATDKRPRNALAINLTSGALNVGQISCAEEIGRFANPQKWMASWSRVKD